MRATAQRPSASFLAGDTLLVNARVGRVHEGRYAVVLAHRCFEMPSTHAKGICEENEGETHCAGNEGSGTEAKGALNG